MLIMNFLHLRKIKKKEKTRIKKTTANLTNYEKIIIFAII